MSADTPATVQRGALMRAILTAQKAVATVAKDSRNEHHGYRYASAEDVLQAAREALDGNGVTVIQSGWRLTPGVESTEDGKTSCSPQLVADYIISHADSGESLELTTVVPVIVSRGRPLDKALFGALTESLAYFLRGLLLIPRGGEDDTPSARNDADYDPARRPATREEQEGFGVKVKALFPDLVPTNITARINAAAKSVLPDYGGSWRALTTEELFRVYARLEADAKTPPATGEAS